MRFSLVIPSYNNTRELSNEVPLLLQYFQNLNYEVEVIIVNDGSSQRNELSEFCLSNQITLLDNPKNMGKGAAVRKGMLHATQDICIFTDADIPFQYSIFGDILKQFEQEEVAVICGTRNSSDYFSKTPLLRRLGSTVFSKCVDIIMLRKMGDTQCGIKAFRKESAKKIFSLSDINGFAADIEWIYLSKNLGEEICWVKAEFRNAGESSVVLWKQALRMLADVALLRLRTIF